MPPGAAPAAASGPGSPAHARDRGRLEAGLFRAAPVVSGQNLQIDGGSYAGLI